MSKDKSDPNFLGDFLRRLRESRNLSLRQAAKEAGISSAYVSQLEGGKRGKRKKGEDYFGPHPQILKKLAEVYHVTAYELMRRAGYLDDDRVYEGFSEEREMDRVFDFVIHDPLLKGIFTVLDKRAIVNRYEAITGKRFITWAGESEHPSASKAEFSGLRSLDGMLYAETPHTKLTLAEVAQELSTTPEEVKKMIEHHWLDAEKGARGDLLIEKYELRGFKDYATRDGIQLRVYTPKAKRPNTAKEFQRTSAEIAAKLEADLPKRIKAASDKAVKQFNLERKKR
jgi:transcriptional regulator with XRE-family HTH domain